MKQSSFLTVLAAAALVFCLILSPCSSARAAETGSTPYTDHGTLAVSGSFLTDSDGNAFQLKGVTVHGIASASTLTDSSVETLRDGWGMNALRVRPTEDERTVLASREDASSLYGLLAQTASLCSRAGIYLIIDWYTADPWDAAAESSAATAFFSNAASAVSDYSGVLYEICGSSLPSWNDMRSFAPAIIDTIRTISPQAVVIAGIPGSIGAADLSLSQPIDRSNILYAVAVDASSEPESSIQKLTLASAGGMALIAAAFQPEQNPGADSVSNAWMDFFNQYSVGYIAGYLFTDDTDTGLLAQTASPLGWTDDDLTAAASWLLTYTRSQAQASGTGSAGFTPSAEAAQQMSYDLGSGLSAAVTETYGSYYGQPSCQYDFVLTNSGTADLSSWRIRVSWQNGDIALYDYWNCEAGGSDGSVVLASTGFNAVIPAGSSQSFGIVVTSTASPQLASVSLEAAN
jgi:endoglucanase